MREASYYLSSNIVVEPLVDQWYAWPHLISPATAAMNIAGRHLRIMESYVSAPQIHQAATRNPAMLGGPFIDYPTEQVDSIQSLIDRTKQNRAGMFQFAEAIKQLDGLLRTEAKGFSLEPLYAKVPDLLKGYVELVYDLNNAPSFRLIEPLLYASPYYDSNAQSLMLSVINQDYRPFILSTPRLQAPGDLPLSLPFQSPEIDRLFRMKRTPQPAEEIREALGIATTHQDLFQSFLTQQPARPYARYEGAGARWRYFGHACILLETRQVTLLLDPVLSYTYESDISRYTYEDLPDFIDYVLITHNHQDHILFETMLQIRHKVGTVIVPRNGSGALQDPSLKLMLQRTGFRNVIEIDEMETLPIDGGEITGLPFLGEHSDLNIRTKTAHLVRLEDHTFLFAADSCNVEPRLYEHIHRLIGDVDVLFLGMECDGAPLSWLYGPLLTIPLSRAMDHSRRLAGSDYERARAIVDRCGCQHVYVYAMGQEPWLNYIMSKKYTDESAPIVASNRLVQECRSRGMVAERLFGEREILYNASTTNSLA